MQPNFPVFARVSNHCKLYRRSVRIFQNNAPIKPLGVCIIIGVTGVVDSDGQLCNGWILLKDSLFEFVFFPNQQFTLRLTESPRQYAQSRSIIALLRVSLRIFQIDSFLLWVNFNRSLKGKDCLFIIALGQIPHTKVVLGPLRRYSILYLHFRLSRAGAQQT